jgi:DNA-binding transcriptional LysR family regulator
MMDLDDLALFVRVARLGSISAAGRDLGASPAAASARLAAFEKRLGARLVHRTTRAATLTLDGLAFLPHAEQVLEAARSARAALGRDGDLPRGTLRAALPASFARMHILPALPDFAALYPDLALDLRLSDVVADLVEGAFDVAVRNAELADSNVVARKLAPDHRLLVAAPSYLAERGVPAVADDLRRHACLVVGGHDRWAMQGRDGAPTTIAVTAALRVDDGGAVRDAAVAGLGVALMSTWCAGDALRAGSLVPVLARHPLVSRHALWAIYPSARLLAPKVRAFIDWLARRFGPGQPYWDAGLTG